MERVRLENEAERRFRSSLNKSGSDIKNIKEDEDEYDEED